MGYRLDMGGGLGLLHTSLSPGSLGMMTNKEQKEKKKKDSTHTATLETYAQN